MRSLVLAPTTMNWSDWMRQNEIVRTWSVKVKKQLRGSAKQFTKGKSMRAVTYLRKSTPKDRSSAKSEYKLADTLKHRVFYKHGISEGTSFRFQRHGVFRHYGTGKGYKRIGGMVVRVIKSKDGNYTPVPGPSRRTPADWFNPIIDRNVPELANRVAEVNADAAVNAMRTKIK